MSAVTSENDLLSCFRDLDRGDVDVTAAGLPLTVTPAAAWSSGPRAYLLFRDRPGGAVKGVVFHRNHGSAPVVATMCEWCRKVRDLGGVKLMSVRASERTWVGQYVCADLECLTSDDPRPLERMRVFAARRLF